MDKVWRERSQSLVRLLKRRPTRHGQPRRLLGNADLIRLKASPMHLNRDRSLQRHGGDEAGASRLEQIVFRIKML
jgi:hypothetical protein